MEVRERVYGVAVRHNTTCSGCAHCSNKLYEYELVNHSPEGPPIKPCCPMRHPVIFWQNKRASPATKVWRIWKFRHVLLTLSVFILSTCDNLPTFPLILSSLLADSSVCSSRLRYHCLVCRRWIDAHRTPWESNFISFRTHFRSSQSPSSRDPPPTTLLVC